MALMLGLCFIVVISVFPDMQRVVSATDVCVIRHQMLPAAAPRVVLFACVKGVVLVHQADATTVHDRVSRHRVTCLFVAVCKSLRCSHACMSKGPVD